MATEHPSEATVFNAARRIPSDEERQAYLKEACGTDAALRKRVAQLLAAYTEESQFLEQPAADLDKTHVADLPGNDLTASLDAGPAPVFDEGAAVILGDANHSVLKMLGNTLNEIPRVSLRESKAEGDDPITQPSSPEMPAPNSHSRYRLDGEIARGGMGAIIKGRDTELGRDLAIKVLLDSHKDKPDVIQRFVEEAQIGGQLQHPGIAPVYDLGQFADQRPYFSMKLVKGETLAKLLADRENLEADRGRFLGIFEQACQTMAYAHSRGVIHRDLKPANIMVGAFGEVQVMDWGLAKVLSDGGVADEKKARDRQQGQSIIQTLRSGLGSDSPKDVGAVGSQTQMGSVMGTPAYMPPEQALGEIDRLDERADVFGLGAILCEILTGKPPYVGADGTQVFHKAIRGKLDDCFASLDASGIDRDLIDLTKHALAVDPESRLRNAGAASEGISAYLAGVQERLKQAELAGAEANARAEHATRRRKLHIAIAGLMLMVAIVAGFGAVRFRQQREVQAQLASKNETLARENAEKRKDAELAKERISSQKKKVEQQKDRALASEAAALGLQETLQRELYIADMRQVETAYHEGATVRVDRILKKYIPSAGEFDQRGWEWHYWWRVNHLHLHQVHHGSTFGMAVSPSRTWLAVRQWQDQLLILTADRMKVIKKVTVGNSHPLGRTELAISPDERFLACIDNNTAVRVWKTADHSELPPLQLDNRLQAIAFSSAGLLATADVQGRVTFWDVEQNSRDGSSLETGPSLSCLAFSPDGKQLAIGHLRVRGGRSANLAVWDVATRELQQPLVTSQVDVKALAWNATDDQSLIAAGFSHGIVRVWEGANYEERDWLIAGGPVVSLSFSRNGEKLAAGTERNNSIVVWGTAPARRVCVMKGHSQPVFGIGFAADNQTLWSSGQDGYLKTWDTSKGEPFDRLIGAIPSPYPDKSLTFSADGQSLWRYQTQEELHRLNPATGDTLQVFDVRHPENRTALSNDGRFLAVFRVLDEARNRIELWRTNDSEPVQLSEHVLPGDFAAPNRMAISEDGSVIAWASGQDIAILNLKSGKQLAISHKAIPLKLALSHDGKLLAAQDYWNTILLNIGGGEPEVLATLPGDGGPVNDVQFSPDGKYFAVAHFNSEIRLHDGATGKDLYHFRGHAGDARAIDFSPNSTLLVSGGDDGTVRLWDIEDQSLLVTLSSHEHPITSVAFSPDGYAIASISKDGDTRIWRGGPANNLQGIPAPEPGGLKRTN